MKKKKRKEVTIKFSNKWLYSLIVIGILIVAGIGVWAYGTSDPPVFGHSAEEIEGIKFKTFEIGDWNMDSTSSKEIDLGDIDREDIRSVVVIIRQDEYGVGYPIDWTQLSTGSDAGYWMIESDKIKLVRQPGSSNFDNSLYDQTSYNRGWVTVGYE